MAKVDKITIQGYKSIKSLENFELKNLNILIGANGVGKSNFISAFRLLNEMYNKRLQLYTQSKSLDNFLYFGRKHTEKIFFSLNLSLMLIVSLSFQLLKISFLLKEKRFYLMDHILEQHKTLLEKT